MGACVARTGCPHFGLLVGQRSGLNSLGLPGLLIRHSPDVGAALRSLVTHLYLQDRGAVPTLAVDGKRVGLGYAIYEPGVENAGQIMDAAAAIGCNVLRGLCGPRWAPTEVQLAHRRPADMQPYRRFFRAPVRFDAPHNVLVFSATWLRQRLPDVSAELQRLLHEEITGVAGHRAVAFADPQPAAQRRRDHVRSGARRDSLQGRAPAPRPDRYPRGGNRRHPGLLGRATVHPGVPPVVGNDAGALAFPQCQRQRVARHCSRGPVYEDR